MNTKNTRDELSRVSYLVENILKNDERARNDDKWLTYLVMRQFTKIYIPFEDFKLIPSFDSIRRTRQKIQNTEGKYIPTEPEVILKRRIRQEQVKEWLCQPKVNERGNI